MDDPCSLYKSQCKKAKETLDQLLAQKTDIDLKLESDPISAALHKELRTVNLDIKITLNELEHAESSLQDCEVKYNLTRN
ncbi:hypothetical protein ACMDB5_09425 [Flavobacterium sp. W1B]|uniref:hypothetical protein n=1 Tax=Flavobacterium sp. W1B TaxID=3394146 RepID=UPI0039BCF9ED